ncbi:MAG: SlyX family protein [Bacteroidales bacterium]|jgi:hypothetical protein|nr:SlyX family protein [Bacteroidales bacterium]
MKKLSIFLTSLALMIASTTINAQTTNYIPKFTNSGVTPTFGNSVIFQNSSDYIGIGTTNPTEKLHVEGSAFFNGTFQIKKYSTLDYGYAQRIFVDRNFTKAIGVSLYNSTSGTSNETFYLYGNGTGCFKECLGIATTSYPVEALQIGDKWTFHNGGSKMISYNSKYTNIGNGIYQNVRIVDDYSSRLEFTSSGSINLVTFGTGLAGSTLVTQGNITLKPNGTVGIGTTSTTFGGTTYKLAVKGTIISDEITVVNTAGWADYVFDENYKLPKLFEIEQFIKANKHLPEVPSSCEVEETGVKLGEMNVLLLQKIEELTLYVIEQQKQLEKLQKKVELLEINKEK